jgi:hypothetical protein
LAFVFVSHNLLSTLSEGPGKPGQNAEVITR